MGGSRAIDSQSTDSMGMTKSFPLLYGRLGGLASRAFVASSWVDAMRLPKFAKGLLSWDIDEREGARLRAAIAASVAAWALLVAGCGGGAGEHRVPDAGPADWTFQAVADAVIEGEESDTVARPMESIRPFAASAGTVPEWPMSTVSGVDEGFTPGCDRTPSADFIDGGTWNNRRLLPRACEVLKYNPPRFSWRVPSDQKASAGWTFVLKTAEGSTVVSAQLVKAYYRHSTALPAGDYSWQVSYRSKISTVGTVVSDTRRFRVPTNAEVFLPPGGPTLAAAVAAKPRPRILPAGMSFGNIRDMVSTGEYADAYQVLLRRAEKALPLPLPAQPSMPPPDGTSSRKVWNRETHKTADGELANIELLAFAWRLSGDGRFRSAGLARLVNIAGWDPNGSTSEANFDLVNAHLLSALARGFDLLGPEMGATQRSALIDSARARLAPILPRLEKLDRNPYNQHSVQLLRDAMDALLWMAGEDDFPEADAWLASTWEHLLRFNDHWGDVDGGFGNGVPYAWYAQNELVDLLVGIRASSGFDFARQPFIRNLPDFLIAHTTPNSRQVPSAGDPAEQDGLYATGAHTSARLFALVTGSPQLSWYWRQGPGAADPTVYLHPHHFIAFAMSGRPPAPAAPTQHSWLFRDAGMVAIHDQPDATATRSTVHFRSSRFGSVSHSWADQNAFALISRGKSLLIPGGYEPWWMSPHHALVGRATRYKNALTFDGGIGQAEPVPVPTAPGRPMQSMDARGEIVDFQSKGPWTTATGDATLAYRGWSSTAQTWTPLLKSAVRTVAYNRSERVVVIYDYATSAIARAFELNFNALAPFTANGSTARVDYEGAAACISIHGASGGFTTSSGFAIPPEFARPQQYQARFMAQPAFELAALTVIREDCRDVAVSIERSGTSFSVGIADAASITLDRAVTVLP